MNLESRCVANSFKLAMQKNKKVVSVFQIQMGTEQFLYWLALYKLIAMKEHMC